MESGDGSDGYYLALGALASFLLLLVVVVVVLERGVWSLGMGKCILSLWLGTQVYFLLFFWVRLFARCSKSGVLHSGRVDKPIHLLYFLVSFHEVFWSLGFFFVAGYTSLLPPYFLGQHLQGLWSLEIFFVHKSVHQSIFWVGFWRSVLES